METTPAISEQLLQALVAQYGANLTAERLADVRRSLDQLESTAHTLRSYRLRNRDEPALLFIPYHTD